MLLLLAHSGHWIESVILIAPVSIVFGWLGVVRLRDHLRARRLGAQSLGASDSTSGP